MLILVENLQVDYCQIVLIIQVQNPERNVLNKQYALNSELRLLTRVYSSFERLTGSFEPDGFMVEELVWDTIIIHMQLSQL